MGGQLVNRATKFQHRKDDSRSKDLDNFAMNVASTILDEGSHLGLSCSLGDSLTLSPLSRETLPQELLTIETEVRGRITWALTNQTLVFVSDPVPDQDFKDPLLLPNYIPHDGLHALSESHQRNLAFIENENWLSEIILHLDTFTDYPEQRNALAEMAITGLQEMMRHKKHEWDQQKMEATAIDDGFIVVRTGLTHTTVCKTQSF